MEFLHKSIIGNFAIIDDKYCGILVIETTLVVIMYHDFKYYAKIIDGYGNGKV